VAEGLPAALLSVWGSSASDVWIVGADTRDGTGPLVLHNDGEAWERIATGQSEGTLWWVHGFEDGPVFMGGSGGVILRAVEGELTRMDTPGSGTVFGIWGADADDLWAVGGDSESSGGFAWRLAGETWASEPTLPEDIPALAAVWKIYGSAPNDAWLVGSNGVALHWDGAQLTRSDTGVGSSLFTVHGRGTHYAAVGGSVTGILVEFDGQWRDVTPEPTPFGLSGVCLGDGDSGIAVGAYGTILSRGASGWAEVGSRLSLEENLHSTWIDPAGGVWAVGGQTFSEPLTDGVILHRGTEISARGL
jgi:hypothetical protein